MSGNENNTKGESVEEVVNDGFETELDDDIKKNKQKKGRGRPPKVDRSQTKIKDAFKTQPKLKRTPVKVTGGVNKKKKKIMIKEKVRQRIGVLIQAI